MRLGVELVQLSMNKKMDKTILIASDSNFEYAVQKAQVKVSYIGIFFDFVLIVD